MVTSKRWLPAIRVSLLIILLVPISGCRVPEALTPSLPDLTGTVGAMREARQAFLAPANGLSGITVAVVPQTGSAGELLPRPTGGARVGVRYAPEDDPRFPEVGFHEWPETQQWLGELTGDRVVGQSFLSRYANLSGITLRVATFGADVSPGQGRLKDGSAVSMLDLPLDGRVVASLPGGSLVDVNGAAEGWAAVRLADGRSGFIDLNAFASLPLPNRRNRHDVLLRLYREPEMSLVRESTLNASDLHDNSHVTFPFDPLPDSDSQRFRFTLSSPESSPGDAVTFRYAPSDAYAGGTRFEGEQPVGGALIFRPVFAESATLYQGDLDTFAWSSLTHTLSGRFGPINATADRYLAVSLVPGEVPLNLKWSLNRPPGGVPMVIDGDATRPGGGLVFNVTFRGDVSLTALSSTSAHSVARSARQDPAFFAAYGLAFAGLLGWGGWRFARRRSYGR